MCIRDRRHPVHQMHRQLRPQYHLYIHRYHPKMLSASAIRSSHSPVQAAALHLSLIHISNPRFGPCPGSSGPSPSPGFIFSIASRPAVVKINPCLLYTSYQSSRQSSNHVKVHSGNDVRNYKSRYGKGIRPTYTVLQLSLIHIWNPPSAYYIKCCRKLPIK